MTKPKIHGHFVWYELMTHDADAAKAFYRDLVGWTMEDFDAGGSPYTILRSGETQVGGLMKMPAELQSQEVPPNWMGYVAAPDIETTVAKLKKLGGAVHREPWSIEGMQLTLAIVADPQGAVFALLTPDDGAKGFDSPGIGEFSWHELATTDYRAAFDFYAELFGWEVIEDMDMGPNGVYRLFGRDGVTWGGMFDKQESMPTPVGWLYYASVPAMDAALETVKAAKGQVLMGPIDVPGGDHIAYCLDPQGAAFALHVRGG
jgi:predicted enzyme related to lactoylglutathione lyase